MSSLSHDEIEYNDVRSKGILALQTVLKQKQNIKIIEKCIHKTSNNAENYNNTYSKVIYQTIGDVLNGTDLKTIVKNIKNEMVGWKHPYYTQIKNIIDEHDEFIVNPFEVEEGVTTCRCGSERVFTYQKQTRGADEPMTTFAKCVKCKAQWSYSG
jgi:DNA-directed RNA polymerase subunit M/transcription elongation factor TFIIS